MNVSDAEKIVDELKDCRLIDRNREVIGKKIRHCGFRARELGLSIEYDLKLLNYLSQDEFLWIILHEEYHLTHKLRGKTNDNIDFIITFFLTSGLFSAAMMFQELFMHSIILLGFLFFVCFGVFLIITRYIHKKYFPQSYYQDEFDADEYAVKGLFLVRPNAIAWQVMYTSFQSFIKCWSKIKRGKSAYWIDILHTILLTAPHPSHRDRIENVRLLFNKYNLKRRAVHTNRKEQ